MIHFPFITPADSPSPGVRSGGPRVGRLPPADVEILRGPSQRSSAQSEQALHVPGWG